MKYKLNNCIVFGYCTVTETNYFVSYCLQHILVIHTLFSKIGGTIYRPRKKFSLTKWSKIISWGICGIVWTFRKIKFELNWSIIFFVISNLRFAKKVDFLRKYWSDAKCFNWIQVYGQKKRSHTKFHLSR